MGRRTRRLGRFLSIALPLAFSFIPVFVFTLLPRLVELGLLQALARDYLSGRVFHSGVEYGAIRFEGTRIIVLEDVQIEALRAAADASAIRRARLIFDEPLPFGRVERVELEGLKVRMDLTPARLSALVRSGGKKPGKSSTDEQPRSATAAARSVEGWLESAAVDLHLGRRTRMPTFVILDSELWGRVADRPYRIHRVQGRVVNHGRTRLEIDLRGVDTITGAPASLVGDAKFGVERSGVDAELVLPGVNVGVSVEADGPAADLDLRIRELDISPAMGELIRAAMDGFEIQGLARGRATLQVRDGRWSGLVLEGSLRRGLVAAEGAVFENEAEAAGTLRAVPAPGGARVTLQMTPIRFRREGLRLDADRLEVEALLVESGRKLVGVGGRAVLREGRLELPDGKGRLEFDAMRLEPDLVRGADREQSGEIALALEAPVYEWQPGRRVALEAVRGSVRGTWSRPGAEIERAVLEIPGLARFAADGRLRRDAEGSWSFEGRAAVEEFDLERAAALARETFGLPFPELHGGGRIHGSAEIREGRAEARLIFEGVSAHWRNVVVDTLDGVARARGGIDGALEGGSIFFNARGIRVGSIRASGVGGSLPIVLAEGAPPRDGWIAAGGLRAGDTPILGPFQARLAARPGELLLPDGLRAEAFGGTLQVGPVAVRGFPARSIETSLSLRGARIADALKAAESRRVIEGTIDVELPRISVSGDRMRVEGRAEARVFGGSIAASSLVFDRGPDATPPLLTFDARADRISLERLSKSLQGQGVFEGTVNATLRGTIDLRKRMPRELELALRNDPDPDEKQMLNLRAVKRMMKASGDLKAAARLEALPFGRLYYADLGLYLRVHPDGWVTLRGKFAQVDKGFAPIREYSWQELRAGVVDRGVEEMIMVGDKLHRLNVFLDDPGTRVHWEQIVERLK